MSRPLQLTSWNAELQQRFPDLPATTVFVLALYSFGVILAKVCGLRSVALFLSKSLCCSYDALKKRLSEFYKEASAKSGFHHGSKRTDFDVATCFAPLLRWVLSLWSGKHLALAIDVTNLGERFHVLCVSVVVAGVGIPVAWKVLLGGVKEPWNPHWFNLLRHLKEAVPDDWLVIVPSDRGLESPDLFRFIVGLGWHPLMRVKKAGKFRPKGWRAFYGFGELVRTVGTKFASEGTAYTGAKMPCTLLACWDEGHDEPWLILTDLPAAAADATWYALRSWIEQGFKLIKAGGWDWEKTRMEDPSRVERLWLVLAVATLWVVAVGAQDEAREKHEQEQQQQAKKFTASQQEVASQQEQQRLRLEKLRQAQQERQSRKESARQRQEEQRKAKKEAKQAKGKQKEEQAKGTESSQDSRYQPKKRRGTTRRMHRLSARGLAVLQACWDKGKTRLPQHLHPQPWPELEHSVCSLIEDDFLAQQT